MSDAIQNVHGGVACGKLVDEDGASIVGVHIELFAKGIRDEMELGNATTEEHGQYTISYSRPSAFNLRVRAHDTSISPHVVIGQSSTVFSAPSEVEIDFTTAADGVIRVPSTFTIIEQAIAAHLHDGHLTDLGMNKEALTLCASMADTRFKNEVAPSGFML